MKLKDLSISELKVIVDLYYEKAEACLSLSQAPAVRGRKEIIDDYMTRAAQHSSRGGYADQELSRKLDLIEWPE